MSMSPANYPNARWWRADTAKRIREDTWSTTIAATTAYCGS
jgi:hypothetical protein